MTAPLILASGSQARAALLKSAGLSFAICPARIDEEALIAALEAEDASPADIADTLAEMKARKVAERYPDACVIGCDQVMELDGRVLGKPPSRDAGRAQLQALRGQTHMLHSAVVLYRDARPVWRFLGTVRLTMRSFSDAYLDAYLDRNWPGDMQTVGTYKVEEEGVRLFSQIEGDHFTVLGLPLIPLLCHLSETGVIQA